MIDAIEVYEDENSKTELKGVEWLWVSYWHDGIIAGVCLHEGKKYYSIKEALDGNKYLVIKLPKEKMAMEEERHRCFEECVGKHWSFTNGELNCVEINSFSEEKANLYYNNWLSRIEFIKGKYLVIGFFNYE